MCNKITVDGCRLRRILEFSAGHRYYPLVVALIAFVATLTFSFPFVVVLIPAVLYIARGAGCCSDWSAGSSVAVRCSSNCSAISAAIIVARFPELVAHASWQLAAGWLDDYGLLALALVAGSPMPQTPVLFFYALADPSPVGTLAAVGVGKTVKYVVLAG